MGDFNLAGYVAQLVVAFLAGAGLIWLQGRPKLISFSPGWATFNIATGDPSNPTSPVYVTFLSIQNVGRRLSRNIEVVYTHKPTHFEIVPARQFNVDISPSGQYVLKFDSLGRQELVSIQILDNHSLPRLQSIRSEDGLAATVQVMLSRIIPRWVLALRAILMVIGAGYIIYWAILIVLAALKSWGIIGA